MSSSLQTLTLSLSSLTLTFDLASWLSPSRRPWPASDLASCGWSHPEANLGHPWPQGSSLAQPRVYLNFYFFLFFFGFELIWGFWFWKKERDSHLSFNFLRFWISIIFSYLTNTLVHFSLNPNGSLVQRSWDDEKKVWAGALKALRSVCDGCGKCGAFGICNSLCSPICSCLQGLSQEIQKNGIEETTAVRESEYYGKMDGFVVVVASRLWAIVVAAGCVVVVSWFWGFIMVALGGVYIISMYRIIE